MTEKKQLVLAVEGNAVLGSYWSSIISDYLEKIIRSFCGNEVVGTASPNVELAVVTFSHDNNSSCFIQQSGWARNVDSFLESLSAIDFSGRGFCDASVAEGLSEALLMFSLPNDGQTQKKEGFRMHCILVSASNPCPMPASVYLPVEKNLNQTKICLADAETMAKSFPQCCVSLSVICPRQLPKLKAIYNAGKKIPSAADPTIDTVKNPHYLVLISENFKEACAALCPKGTPVTSVPPDSELPATYVNKIWEGELSFLQGDQHVFISRLECSGSSKLLTEDWPPTMLIDRLLPRDFMITIPHAPKAKSLVFRSMDQHALLKNCYENKLCMVIRLPSQTLLMAVSGDQPRRLIGMLFPKEMVVFEPQIPEQKPPASKKRQRNVSSSGPKA